MDYEQKYKEAIERAKRMFSEKELNYLFPELRESEDERIKHEIRNFIWSYPDKLPERDKWLAWFEKQEHKESDPRYKCVEGLLEADAIYQMSMNEAMVEEAKSKAVNALSELAISELLGLEKQDEHLENHDEVEKESEQKSIFNADDWYVSKVDGKIYNAKFIEKQDEQKPTDNVEPKFHPGDWIVDDETPNDVFCVIEVLGEIYKVIDIDGYDYHIPHCKADNQFHLWTIHDAKNGDVLASKDRVVILIFRNLYTNISFSSYYNTTGKGEFGWSSNCFIPATKAQRDLLFQKMEKSGYEWDCEKKELKKK